MTRYAKVPKSSSAAGYDVTYLKPDSTGSIPVDAVKNALRPDTILVSLMLVNNETGAINDISSVSKLLKSSGSPALLHTDAVQAFMKIPFTPKSLGADMISVSGHKIHAPKGIGALYVRSGLRLKPYIMGGSQEDGRRAGTEAMPQIAAFGEACRIAKENLAENAAKMAALRQLTIDTLTPAIPELQVINGRSAAHPQHLSPRLAQRGPHELPRSARGLCFPQLRLQEGRAQPRARSHRA